VANLPHPKDQSTKGAAPFKDVEATYPRGAGGFRPSFQFSVIHDHLHQQIYVGERRAQGIAFGRAFLPHPPGALRGLGKSRAQLLIGRLFRPFLIIAVVERGELLLDLVPVVGSVVVGKVRSSQTSKQGFE